VSLSVGGGDRGEVVPLLSGVGGINDFVLSRVRAEEAITGTVDSKAVFSAVIVQGRFALCVLKVWRENGSRKRSHTLNIYAIARYINKRWVALGPPGF